MVYLFIGQDSQAKDIQLHKIRQEQLPKELEQFNLDILHAKELTLQRLQERCLSLPVKSAKRIIVIRQAQELSDEAKEFLLKSAEKQLRGLTLVLDLEYSDRHDNFVSRIQRYAKVFRFRETIPLDTFSLSRQINLKRPDYALRVLNQLLNDGERPERILGGLRYTCEKDPASPMEKKRRLKLLLNCDIDIKTGRLKPDFALEKLVICLCGFGKPLG